MKIPITPIFKNCAVIKHPCQQTVKHMQTFCKFKMGFSESGMSVTHATQVITRMVSLL